jgi:hypothetical protein
MKNKFVVLTPKRPVFQACAILLFLLPFTAHALPFFSGLVGFEAGVSTPENQDVPRVSSDLYFGGLLDINGFLFTKIAVSVGVADSSFSEIIDDAPSSFRLNEASLTFRLRSFNMAHYISVFAGEFESFGTSTFLQKHFGAQPIDSIITGNITSSNKFSIYAFNGYGASYAARYRYPVAIALYAYSKKYDDEQHLKLAGRLAGAFPFVVFDATAGVDLPLAQDKSLDTIIPQAALSVLFGDRFTYSALAQAGIVDYVIKNSESSELSLDNFFALFEARLNAPPIKIHVTGFCMPQSMYESLFYISSPYGASVTVFSDSLYISTLKSEVGVNYTFAVQDISLKGKTGILSEYGLFLAPFFALNFQGGTATVAARINVMHLDNWNKTFALKIGYEGRF